MNIQCERGDLLSLLFPWSYSCDGLPSYDQLLVSCASCDRLPVLGWKKELESACYGAGCISERAAVINWEVIFGELSKPLISVQWCPSARPTILGSLDWLYLLSTFLMWEIGLVMKTLAADWRRAHAACGCFADLPRLTLGVVHTDCVAAAASSYPSTSIYPTMMIKSSYFSIITSLMLKGQLGETCNRILWWTLALVGLFRHVLLLWSIKCGR